MGRRKNLLKSRVDCCFFCGKELQPEHKIIHRLNNRKEHKTYNVIIVCEHCKQRLLNKEVTYFDISTEVIQKYFKNFDRDCRQLVMNKVFRYIIIPNSKVQNKQHQVL